MRKLAIIILGCLFSSFGLLPVAYSLPWPPEMDLVYIKFDYSSGYSYDALNINKEQFD